MTKAPQYTEETPQRESGQIEKWVNDPNEEDEGEKDKDDSETENPLSEDKAGSPTLARGAVDGVATFDVEDT